MHTIRVHLYLCCVTPLLILLFHTTHLTYIIRIDILTCVKRYFYIYAKRCLCHYSKHYIKLADVKASFGLMVCYQIPYNAWFISRMSKSSGSGSFRECQNHRAADSFLHTLIQQCIKQTS